MDTDWKDSANTLEDFAFRSSNDYKQNLINKQPPQTLGSMLKQSMDDHRNSMVNHPPHYTQHPSGVECVQITEHMTFCLGNAIKYIWRAGLKSPDPIMDLEKASFYINREIQRLKNSK